MNFEFKITADRAKEFQKAVSILTRTKVLVGVPAAKAERQIDDDHGAPRHINNAALAYIHDNGAPEANIPARPFMQPGIENAKDAIVKGMRRAGDVALAGGEIEKDLTRVGLIAQSAIQEKITDGPFVPLKPATIKRKGSDRPLIDTGQMRRSISFVVEKPQI